MGFHYDLMILPFLIYSFLLGIAEEKKSKNVLLALCLALSFSGKWPLHFVIKYWPGLDDIANTQYLENLPQKNITAANLTVLAHLNRLENFRILKTEKADWESFLHSNLEPDPRSKLKAFEAIGNPLEDDRETFKELKKEGRKMFRELPEAFNEGYSTALESGMRIAANEKAAAKPSLADDFYNAMLEAIRNKSKPDYVKGYSDAGKMLDDMNRKGNMPTADEMKMSLQLLPNFVRKRLLEAIEEEYKEFSKINPDKSKTEQLREHKERKNNYKTRQITRLCWSRLE
jgi:hypothetical protein